MNKFVFTPKLKYRYKSEFMLDTIRKHNPDARVEKQFVNSSDTGGIRYILLFTNASCVNLPDAFYPSEESSGRLTKIKTVERNGKFYCRWKIDV